MQKKFKISLFAVGALLMLSLITFVSYALWTITKTQRDPSSLASGCFAIEMIDGTKLELQGEFPVTDEEGIHKEPYQFTIKNTCSVGANADIKLLITNNTTAQINHVKAALSGDAVAGPKLISLYEDGTTETQNIAHTKILTNTFIAGNTTQTYELRLWIDEDVTKDEERTTTLEAKVEIDAAAAPKPLYADASGASVPVLSNGMTAVIYDEDANVWKIADVYSPWYDYNTQWWANAVTFVEDKRITYQKAPAGTEINIEDVNTMWVWIPRYEYQTDNLGTNYAGGSQTLPGGINVNFIAKDVTTPSAGNHTIHDAFWWDDNNNNVKEMTEQLPGFWFAKFEISPKETCNGGYNEPGVGCDNIKYTPQVVPNKKTWMETRVGTYWTTIHQKMNGATGEQLYGLKNSDTHMMKNMEWGAVAYLSQSKYGKYGNTEYTGQDKEVYANNRSGYQTGASGGNYNNQDGSGYYTYNGGDCTSNLRNCAPTTFPNKREGYGASTTGNIYGAYDMNSGAFEYVMGMMKVKDTENEPAVGERIKYESGFAGKYTDGTTATQYATFATLSEIGSKYYDLYDYSEDETEPRYKIGDATYETPAWYSDAATYTTNQHPYLARGGGWTVMNETTGIFEFHGFPGYAGVTYSTRPASIPLSY